jgi:glutamate synthase (NADPH/NADH)
MVCPQQGSGYILNPVLNGLRDLGILNNKSKGIPLAYMQADKDTRLALIAGLIESDGTYVKSHNT